VAAALALRGSHSAIALGVGFSAGLMSATAALELIPQSAVMAGPTATAAGAALGAALVWSAHVVIPHVHLFEEKGAFGRTAMKYATLVLLGLMLHDLAEGVALASAYVAAPDLGVLVAIVIALHNLPEQFAMAVPAIMTRRRYMLFAAAIGAAMAEPLGAALGLVAAGSLPQLNPHLMAFAAGAMLFVAVHELLPMARRYGRIPLFVAGGALSLPVYWVLAHLTVGPAGWTAP
jgi:ZIP family zinc transporter